MRKGIVAAGNWIVDKVKTLDRWPDEGELCNISSVRASGGGGPCNVLFDIAAMRAAIPLHACGVVGNDHDGKYLLEQIRVRGINADCMRVSHELPTSSTDVMSVNGRRTFFHNRGANAQLDSSMISAIDVPAKIFYLGYLLLLDALDQPHPTYGSQAAYALDAMQKRGYLTVVDFVSESPEKFARIIPPALKYIDCLVINEVEAGNSTASKLRDGKGVLSLDKTLDAARKLIENGVDRLVVIHFPEGAVAVGKDGETAICPSCHIARKDIVGSVGAGDAFCSGILYGLHEDIPLRESLLIASACAWFNLKNATATDGAVSIERIRQHLKSCAFSPELE